MHEMARAQLEAGQYAIAHTWIAHLTGPHIARYMDQIQSAVRVTRRPAVAVPRSLILHRYFQGMITLDLIGRWGNSSSQRYRTNAKRGVLQFGNEIPV
jgi:hypothetical protein